MCNVYDLIAECMTHKNCVWESGACYYKKECDCFQNIFKMTPEELGNWDFINNIKIKGEFIKDNV